MPKPKMEPSHVAAAYVDQVERLERELSQVRHELAAYRATNSELEQRNEDLTDFIENAEVPLHWVGPDGRILWANRAELDLLGYSESEYVGHHIGDFHADEHVIRDILARLAADQPIRNYEARLRCKDGAIRHVSITSSVRRHSGTFLHTRCFTADITDLKRSDSRLEMQFAVSRLLNLCRDPADGPAEILRTISEHLDFAAGGWWSRTADGRGLYCTAAWKKPHTAVLDPFIRDTRERTFESGAGLPGRVWAEHAAVWISTLHEDPNFPRAPLARSAGLHTGIAVPVSDGSQCLAVMEFFTTDRRMPDRQLLEALTSTGRDVGQFLARQQAERELESRAAELEILYDMAAAVNAAVSLEHIYSLALTALEKLFGVSRSSILMFDSAGVMRFKFWHGISEEYRAAVDGHSPWRPEEAAPNPVLVADVATDQDLAPYRRAFNAEGIAALAFIPLMSRGRLIGRFMLYYAEPHAFSGSEVTVARTIATHVAVAIERKETEAAMREQQARLSLALHAANTGVWEWDIPGNHVVWSDRVYEIHGLRPGSISGVPAELPDLFHPEDREIVSSAVLGALKERGSYQVDFRIIRPDGEVRWITTSGRVVCNAADEPVRVIGTTVDITDRKQAEAALRESSETVQALLESASQAILSVDEQGCIITANAMAERIFGYRREELKSAPLELLVPERFRQSHLRHRHTFLASPSSRAMGVGMDLTGRRKDGTEFPVEISLSSVATRTGRLAVSFITDISTRKRAEEELRQSEERYRALFEYSNDALGVSADDKFEYVNAAFARMFGYDRPQDLSGVSIYETVPPASRETIRKHRAERRDAGSLQPMLFESAGQRRDGTEFLSEVRATDFWMGGRLYTLAILRDITAEREAEEALARQAEELARSNADLQQFAYATSHDLQEPLRNIRAFTQLLARRYQGQLDSQADEFINTIVAGCGRMESLIRDLLAFSRVTNSEPAPHRSVDMNATVRWAVNNLETSVREAGAEITIADLPAVTGDQGQLVQLLQNLLSNAIKYRRLNPRIAVAARRCRDEWIFSVEDNGVGIAPQYYERVFGLFKRLHGREIPGTGVGLAICKKIVEKHGGRIWVESVPGSGSTFLFTLPADPLQDGAA